MSRITFKLLDKTHSICSVNSFDWPPGMVPRAAKAFYNSCGVGDECTNAVIAIYQNEIIGIFRYDATKRNLYAMGTWVSAQYRRNRIGFRLWEKALNANSAKYIDVSCMNIKSYTMLKKLSEKYKDKKFKIHNMFV